MILDDDLTSVYAYDKTGSKDVGDEIHVILVDEDGEITGVKDRRGDDLVQSKQVIESYDSVSVANGLPPPYPPIKTPRVALHAPDPFLRFTFSSPKSCASPRVAVVTNLVVLANPVPPDIIPLVGLITPTLCSLLAGKSPKSCASPVDWIVI